MDEIQARHRKELKDLQNKITQKKKQASKKTRKGVNDECDRLEADLKAQQAAEIAAWNGEASLDDVADDLDDLHVNEKSEEAKEDEAESVNLANAGSTATQADRGRKPNRQKARLARRAAEQDEVARQAAEEAENLPDMKQQERDRMLSYMSERSLVEKEIRADGHCLYSAVADQLTQLDVPLSTASATTQSAVQYKLTRDAAADYIEGHGDDFAPFLEEPLPGYVHKIRDTAEWGGQLELQALAKVYGVEINVLQDFGRVEKIKPDGDAKGEIWLGYYKHGFGLGEHYNSLRKK